MADRGHDEGARHRLGADGTAEFDPVVFVRAYLRHVASVTAYFGQRPQDLLVIDICGGEGWERLCPFLGKQMPNRPFPRLNVFGESDWDTMQKRDARIRPSARRA